MIQQWINRPYIQLLHCYVCKLPLDRQAEQFVAPEQMSTGSTQYVLDIVVIVGLLLLLLLLLFIYFLMKLYYNTDTLRTILKQVYYKKQKQKTKKQTKKHTTYNTIACATTYNAKTNTTHNYLHYNCKTTHTHTTHALKLGQGIVFSRLLLLQYYWHYISQSC